MPLSKLGNDNNPQGMNGWQVEASPPNAGAEHPSHVRLVCSSRGRSSLTGAGLFALRAVFTTYLTSAKLAAIIARAGATPIGTCVMSSTAWIDILPEDGPTQIPLICAVFQSNPTNVTAGP